MNESGQETSQSGVCLIKSEFIVKDHERCLSTQHLAKEDLSKLEQQSASVDSNSSGSKRQKVNQPIKKLKGQNRERRANDKSEWRRKAEFCPDVSARLTSIGECDPAKADSDAAPLHCNRGESCKFQHDPVAYLSEKPGDIGSECYVHRLTGYCPWGISCRFGGDHLTKEGVNVINRSLYGSLDPPKKHNANALDKETVNKLWKRKYDFSRTNAALALTEHKTKYLGERSKAGTDSASLTPDLQCPDSNGEVNMPDDVSSKEKICLTADNGTSGDGSSAVKDEMLGTVDDTDLVKPRLSEKMQIDWRGLLYLSPLTTVGNLPFRRICVEYGADVTCSEMALALSLLQGTREWTLVKRHQSEKIFGVQICGNNPVVMTKTAQLLEENACLDFVDINLGCPIDALYQQGCGSGMMARKGILRRTCEAMSSVLIRLPLTVKLRTGITSSTPLAHTLVPMFRASGVSLATVHGRSREQRYTRNADWAYIDECAQAASPMPIFGNGDVLSFADYQRFLDAAPNAAGAMIGRGALIKPWIFREIKEKRHIDISSSERFDIIKKYVHYGLEHWGSDTRGVETTRRFLLEWLSFLHRYVPLGLLESPPQLINQRPPVYRGRDDMETMLASANCSDWIKISEMILGPVPEGFVFLPKHKSNAWK